MSASAEIIVARATATIGGVRYKVSIDAGPHQLVADEPTALGGQDAGPPPFGLLLAALGACTAATLKMYAEHKQWPLESLGVDLKYLKRGDQGRIERILRPAGALDDAQTARLMEIAERTPVTLALMSGVPIRTELAK
jgi:putative redox protein